MTIGIREPSHLARKGRKGGGGGTVSAVILLPGGVLPKQLGRGVRPASQNPYPIYE